MGKKYLSEMNFPEASTIYCFSSTRTLTLFKVLYPEKADAFLSLRELMLKLGFALPSESEHKLAFTSLLPHEIRVEEKEAELFYDTIQTLREALILRSEHVEHCFSLLAPSKKNTLLKNIFINYLNSPLSHDLAEVVWQLTGELTEKKRSIDFPLVFVTESSDSYLFTTLCEKFPTIYPWQVLGEKNIPSGSLQFGSQSESLLGFTENLKLWNKNKQENQKLWIPFFGDEKELEYLQFYLDSQSITYRSFFENKEKSNDSEFSLFLKNLRRNKTLPLKERLELNQTYLLKKSAPLDEAKEMDTKPSTTETLGEPTAYLYPFQVLTPEADATIIGYCPSSFLSGESSEILFTESELESLFQGGFPLPRRSKIIEFRKRMLENAVEQGNTIYTSIGKQSLSSETEAKPIALHFESTEVKEKYDADVKINRLSATQLETYSQCPAKYFFLNRLRMRAPLSFKDSYALVLGQTVHLALETSCKEKFPFTLEELNTHYANALKEYLPEDESSASHQTILNSQFKLIADRAMVLEKTLTEQFGEGSPILIEDSFELEIEGLKFTGKIDRVDLRDGKIVILDYKTGNVDFTPEHIRKGANFQALLYILAVEKKLNKPLSGMLFYDLKQGELKRGLLIEEEVSKEAKKSITRGHTLSLEKFEALKADGINQIKLLAQKMNSGVFAPEPSQDKCGYCEARLMCRKAYGYV